MFPKALADREFVVYYQPKVTLADNQLCGCEALVRWFRDGAMVPPMNFIPVLEREAASASWTSMCWNRFAEMCGTGRRKALNRCGSLSTFQGASAKSTSGRRDSGGASEIRNSSQVYRSRTDRDVRQNDLHQRDQDLLHHRPCRRRQGCRCHPRYAV